MDSSDHRIQYVSLCSQAPQKPSVGTPCNGCGVCCAAELCPLARLFLGRGSAPCPALEWSEGDARYYCGMVKRPSHYLRWLPAALDGMAGLAAGRWIAAGRGCDSDAQRVE